MKVEISTKSNIMNDFDNKTDSEILALAISKPSIFAVLIDRYQKEFLRKISFILKNTEEAEDVVQDAFVKIYMNAAKFKVQEGASAKSWMYKILLNTCYTYCAKKKREKQFLEYAAPEDLDLLGEREDIQKKLDIDTVLSALTRIPTALARMISLNLFEGKTYEDIAVAENMSVGAVRTKMHRAKKELQKVFTLYAK